MRPATLIIDDEGRVHDGRSAALRAELSAFHLGDRFADYAIRNLGFIAVAVLRGSMRLQLRPSHVSEDALGGLYRHLAEERPERVLLSKLAAGRWTHVFLDGRARFDSQVASIVARAREGHAAVGRTARAPSGALQPLRHAEA
jgi:hypothetical protein